MSAVPVQLLTRRPQYTGRQVGRGSTAPTSLVLVADVEAAAEANQGKCNDSNPYN
jgi:hypothetical protein